MVTEKFQNTLNMIAKMFPIYYLELVLCFLFLVFLITQTTQSTINNSSCASKQLALQTEPIVKYLLLS